MSKVKISELADKMWSSVKLYIDERFNENKFLEAEQERKMKQYVNKKIKEAMNERL